MCRRVTVVGCVFVSVSIFPYSNRSAKKTYGSPQRCNRLILKRVFFVKKPICKLQNFSQSHTSTPVRHLACSRGAWVYMYSHDTAPWPHDVLVACFAIVFAHHYCRRWSRTARDVHLPEGRYVLSAMLHAPKENSRGFSTFVPSYGSLTVVQMSHARCEYNHYVCKTISFASMPPAFVRNGLAS